MNAGNQLNSTVEGETKKVQGNYGADDNPPAGPAQRERDPAAAGGRRAPGVNAKAAAPDAVPAGNVSLDTDAAARARRCRTPA